MSIPEEAIPEELRGIYQRYIAEQPLTPSEKRAWDNFISEA